ncbi:MAG: thioesterase family protein [Actinomycetota bacterium]|nr:thioesterase family protein [Actinomycetota bacterium]
MSAPPAEPFAAASAITAIGDDGRGTARFAGEVSAAWTILGKPNGGYLLTMLARAAVATGPHPHVLAASAHFLQAPNPGPALITAAVLRPGRRAGQLRVRLEQDGRPRIEALMTTGTLDPSALVDWSSEPPVSVAPFERCVRLPPRSPDGRPVAIMGQVELRLDPQVMGFATGQPSGRGELRGWLTLLEAAAFGPVDLLYAADAFPPASFEVAATGWVPTLELTVYVRGVPEPGPLRVRQRARLITGDRLDEICDVWDSAGRLVAQGVQLAGIRLA